MRPQNTEIDQQLGDGFGDHRATSVGVDRVRLDAVSGDGAGEEILRYDRVLGRGDQRTGVVLGQVSVGAKTNEIPMLAGLLQVLDIEGAVVTADALRCQRETAQTIRDRGGHYILTVKGN